MCRPSPRRVVATLALVLAPAAARAGNDESVPLGDDAALTGHTVAAMVADGSSLFYNPAGLAGAERDQIDVGATATMVRAYRLPDLLTTTGGAAGDASFLEFVSVPSAVSYVRTLAPDLKLGLGLFVPETFAWAIDVPLAAGDNTFHVSTTLRRSIYYGVVGLGWRATPRLRLGASLSAIYLSGLGMAAAWAGYAPAGGAQRLFGLSQMFAETILGTTMMVGAQWEPTPGLRLGAALRAPGMVIATSLSGSIVQGTATTEPPSTEVVDSSLSELELDFRMAQPLRFRLGIAWTWGTSWLSVEGDIQPGLTDEALNVRRNVTWNVRAGGLVEVASQTWIGFGVFTDRSPDAPPMSAIETSINYYGLTFGVRLDHPHVLGPGERARDVVFSTTFAVRYAYGSGDIGGIRFDEIPVGEVPLQFGVVGAHVHELGLHLGSTVYF